MCHAERHNALASGRPAHCLTLRPSIADGILHSRLSNQTYKNEADELLKATALAHAAVDKANQRAVTYVIVSNDADFFQLHRDLRTASPKAKTVVAWHERNRQLPCDLKRPGTQVVAVNTMTKAQSSLEAAESKGQTQQDAKGKPPKLHSEHLQQLLGEAAWQAYTRASQAAQQRIASINASKVDEACCELAAMIATFEEVACSILHNAIRAEAPELLEDLKTGNKRFKKAVVQTLQAKAPQRHCRSVVLVMLKGSDAHKASSAGSHSAAAAAVIGAQLRVRILPLQLAVHSLANEVECACQLARQAGMPGSFLQALRVCHMVQMFGAAQY